MRRREFIKLISGAAAIWPLAAHAQQTLKAARIGYLAFRSPLSVDDAFFQGLHDLVGLRDRTFSLNAALLWGTLTAQDSATELVRLKVDVIVAAASAAAQAAKDATSSIPIVFANAGDPVGQGFVQSLRIPGETSRG